MTEPREVRIDGCLDWALEVHNGMLTLTLYSARTLTGDVQKREPVQLIMPEEAGRSMMYALASAFPPETVLPIIQDAMTDRQMEQ